MSRLLKPFDFSEPKTVGEAVQLLALHGREARILAGGTDLILSMKRRKIVPQSIVCIKGISDLDYISYRQEIGLRIGALTTHSTIAASPVVQEKFDLLAVACFKLGTPQVRNMGTIGGNVCEAGPSQDTPPVLLVLDAKLKLVGPKGERILPIDEFYIAPYVTALGEAEILTEIQIPTPVPKSAGCYKWLTKIVTVDETLVGVAVVVSLDSNRGVFGDVKIALCSVARTPFRARRTEEMLRGQKVDGKTIEEASQIAAEETSPRSRADYRRRISSVLVRDAVTEACQKIP